MDAMVANFRLNQKTTMSGVATSGALAGMPGSIFRAGALLLLASSALLSSCSDTPTGNVAINQADGMVLNPPEFLQGRAIVQTNLTPRVSVVADGVSYDAVQTNSTSAPWIGQVYVPEGSSPTVNIMWVETQVPGLAASFNGELPLAITTVSVDNIIVNEAMAITTDQYVLNSTDENPQPLLDIDSDGASNLEERQRGSRPGDPNDIPPAVLVLYNDRVPNIDGQYDSLWNTAQFRDLDGAELGINNLLLDNGVVDTAISSDFRWAAMHDGDFMYLMVFAESGSNQTPTSDSDDFVYEDDSVDIYWDGNNSKGASYDGVDDFHVIVGLLDENDRANRSTADDARIQTGDRSAPLDLEAIQYAVCLCNGDQQIYEFRLDLTAMRIPVDSTFGFELNINNDADGGARDAKWTWFNDTGIDDTWRFPLRMGNVRLEPVPN
ncbi:CBM9 family sugar-binding protein [Granulosicoccus sp.]|nr:sugar-binding protein [Granulosicoccus sp.]MDB4222733.1 CBM9 family sugar-binding protein [Granulosicoccus sp.]